MRLLYLYINSYRCFRQKHPLEINFTTNFRFHLEQDSSPNIILAYEKTSDKLPDNFFSVDSTDDVVTEVSAIMGENGGGKTTLASFLQRSRMVDAKKNKFVIVYEKEETRKWVVLSTMGTIVVSPQNPQPKSGYTWSIDENVGYLPVEEILKMDFDYVYYSPHYTTQYAFSLHDDPSCTNLSTTALFSKRPDYYYNKNCSRRDSISFIQRGFETEQQLWCLDFAGEYVKWDEMTRSVIGIPAPRIVFLRPNIDMAEVSTIVLQQQASADRMPIDGDPAYSIEIAAKALGIVEKLKPNAQDVFLGSFMTFILNYFRNVPVGRRDAHQQQDKLGLKLLNDLPTIIRPSSSLLEQATLILEKLKECKNLTSALLDAAGVNALIDFFTDVYIWDRPYLSSNMKTNSIPFEQEHFDNPKSALYRMIVNHGLSTPVNAYISVEFDPPMSSGEETYLSMFARLFWYFKHYSENKRDVLLFMDESETSLHPEWQQKLTMALIIFLNKVAKGYKVHVIFASHSPMILSDIPVGNAVFLRRRYEDEKKRAGAFSEQVFTQAPELDWINTFGANIIDLYGSSFFLHEGTIGSFAKYKINQYINQYSKEQTDRDFVKMIGDPFIRTIVEDSIGG